MFGPSAVASLQFKLHVQVGACCRHLPELQPRPPIKARTPEACGAACMDTAGCNYVDHHHTYKACILCSACRRESPRIVSKGYTSWRKITAFTAPCQRKGGWSIGVVVQVQVMSTKQFL